MSQTNMKISSYPKTYEEFYINMHIEICVIWAIKDSLCTTLRNADNAFLCYGVADWKDRLPTPAAKGTRGSLNIQKSVAYGEGGPKILIFTWRYKYRTPLRIRRDESRLDSTLGFPLRLSFICPSFFFRYVSTLIQYLFTPALPAAVAATIEKVQRFPSTHHSVCNRRIQAFERRLRALERTADRSKVDKPVLQLDPQSQRLRLSSKTTMNLQNALGESVFWAKDVL